MRLEAAAFGAAAIPRKRRASVDSRVVIEGLVRLGDAAIILLSGLMASQLRFHSAHQPDVVATALTLGLLFAASLFTMLGLYRAERLTRLDQLPRLLGGWALTVGAILVLLYGVKSSEELSRLWTGYWVLTGWAGLTAWRLTVRRACRKAQASGRFQRTVVVIGEARLIAGYLARLEAAAPVRVVAALAMGDEPQTLPAGIQPLSDPLALEELIGTTGADQVVLAMPLDRLESAHQLLRWLQCLPVEIDLYQDPIGPGLRPSGLVQFADTVLLRLVQQPIGGWSYILKRLEDWLLSAVLLVAFAPLMLTIAAAIKLTSPGPLLYRQIRCGLHGERILVLKFRTMRIEVCDPSDAAHVRQAVRNDPRTTLVGRWLRRSSLDELPQLLNVFRGEMSLVGPRPHALAHDRQYSQLIDDYLIRQRVKPGLTGWAQVNGCRGETSSVDEMRRRIELDLEYIRNWSVLLDARILIRTVLVGFHDANAY